jgi:hypothetical protein
MMKKARFMIWGIGILCIALFLGTSFVSAREELHENEVWISGFEDSIGPEWSSTLIGDDTDIEPTSDIGAVNYVLLGRERTWKLNETTAPFNNDTWIPVNNSAYPYRPDYYNVTSEGFYVSHYWGDEDGVRADQSVSIHFDTNISIDETMTDYEIISASVSAEINASVHANSGSTAGIEVIGDPTAQYADYDYIRYYLLISDLTKEKL